MIQVDALYTACSRPLNVGRQGVAHHQYLSLCAAEPLAGLRIDEGIRFDRACCKTPRIGIRLRMQERPYRLRVISR